MQARVIRSSEPHHRIVSALLLLAIFALGLLPSAHAQTAGTLHTVHTIKVDAMGSGTGSGAIRQRLIERLKTTQGIEVVQGATAADVTLHGTSSIWPTGTVSSTRTKSVRMTNYEGYLSVEAAGKSGVVLWSYLATPSRFQTASITSDLADQIVARLLAAIKGGTDEATPAAASGAVAAVQLHAAGATLPAPLYLKWFQSAGVPVSYDAIGSEAGLQQLKNGKVDFAASDMPLPAEQASGELRVLQIPTVAGGVVPIYNLPGMHSGLKFTAEILAGIYSGKIRKWNDPRILDANRGAHLPNADIAVIHRADGSGTTFVWTSYLSLTSPEWKSSVGSGTHVNWPAGTGATGSDGVAAAVQKTPNAIGYVELIYAIQHHLDYAAVKNPAGQFIKASLASITAAAIGNGTEQNAPLSILNNPGRDAYPISTFTWLLVPTQGIDQPKKASEKQLITWMLTTGQKQCASLGYVPLPREIANHELQLLTTQP